MPTPLGVRYQVYSTLTALTQGDLHSTGVDQIVRGCVLAGWIHSWLPTCVADWCQLPLSLSPSLSFHLPRTTRSQEPEDTARTIHHISRITHLPTLCQSAPILMPMLVPVPVPVSVSVPSFTLDRPDQPSPIQSTTYLHTYLLTYVSTCLAT
jgi:hypothetical protein